LDFYIKPFKFLRYQLPVSPQSLLFCFTDLHIITNDHTGQVIASVATERDLRF